MISKYFIERPIFANVIAIVIVIVGLIALKRLPVTHYPEIVPPTIQVSTRYPGASANVVAKTIGVPIEQAVNGVERAIYMSSTSGSDGSYTLIVTFDIGTDLDKSLTLVQNAVNGALSQLPEAAQKQGVTVKKVSTNMLLMAALYSGGNRFSDVFLSNYAIINLQNPLARLPGVGEVKVFGAGPYSMRVWLDPGRLRTFGLKTSDVISAIEGQNVELAAGQLGMPPVPAGQPTQLTITALGRLADVSQFENIIIKTAAGPAPRLVRLRDVAKVDLSQQYFSNFTIASGRKTAVLAVYALPGANAIATAKGVYKAMAEMSRSFPAGLKYSIPYDTTIFVRESIAKVYETLLIAAVLVLVVITVFLQDFRGMMVPATTVPVTIIGAFIAIDALGFTINIMTLFALILVIGIVVDDAIIIVENSTYYIERGLPPKEASIQAMKELTGPIMGITLALVSVFLPASFLPGLTGQIFRQFALVIAATTIISALNALTLKPAQCASWLRPRAKGKKQNWFFRGFNKIFQGAADLYTGAVSRMLKRPGLFAAVFAVIVIVTFLVFMRRPTGFLPTEDQGYVFLIAQLPPGASQQRMLRVAHRIDSILKKTPGVASWISIGGFSILDFAVVPNVLSTFISFKEWSVRGSALDQYVIVSHINRQLARIQDARAYVAIPPPIAGLGQTGGFQMMLEDRGGLGMDELERATNNLVKSANAEPDLAGVQSTLNYGNPQIYLNIDRTKAEAYQVSMQDVFDTLQSYLGSSFVNLFNKYNQVFQVYVQAGGPYRLNLEDIRNLYVRNSGGGMVPMGALLNVRHVTGSELLTRYNLYPAAPIFGSAAPGRSSGQALALMERTAAKILPPGMAYDWTSSSYQEKKAGSQTYLVYALSIIFVYLVLAALYESWTSPAAVIFSVPMALVGIMLALVARGYDNNLYTQIGLVLMIALASKNAILIVEYARDLHKEGKSLEEAALEATSRRFRPIVMTSFAFILGVVPLVAGLGAGAASQRAIGTVVFGGMLSSTLLAIPFVPVFYVLIEGLGERLRKRKQKEFE